MGPLVFLNHQDDYTLSLMLYLFQNQHSATPWNEVMAAATMVVLPVLILFLIAQRVFVGGVVASGRKG